MENKRKFRGGADKNREKQRKLLMKEAGKCKNISDMFNHKSKSSREIPVDHVFKSVINDLYLKHENDAVVQPDKTEEIPVDHVFKSVINDLYLEHDNDAVVQPDKTEEIPVDHVFKSVINDLYLEHDNDAVVQPDKTEEIPVDHVFKSVINDLYLEHDNDTVVQPDKTETVTAIVKKNIFEENTVFDNDPAKFIQIKSWTPELRKMVQRLGPCQPNNCELENQDFPKNTSNRSFHSSWYSRKLVDNTFVNREWLTYSPKLDKIFCLYCILYDTKSNDAWVKNGFNYWKNGLMAIVKHEVSETHIMASLKIKLSSSCLPILPSLTEEHHRQVTFNRDVVKQLIEITIFLAKHNLSFRGHNECWENELKGNFKDMVDLLAQNSPTLSVHINNLKNNTRKERSFISWERQNLLIESVAEYLLSVIKSQINSAQLFSICIDSTFDVSHKEQLSFIVRYIFDGKIHERLLALTESSNTSGEALFEQFKSVMERNNLDWKNNLIGQSYDGAANMRGTYNGLQARILEINPKALYIWCYAHRLNLIVLSAVGSCTEAIDLFGNLEKLYTFINCSKKRADLYRQKQSQIYPHKQIRAVKRVGTTRWMSTSFALTTVLETLEAILDMLSEVKTHEGTIDYKTGSECSGLLSYFQSSRFIISAFMFKSIFDIVEPLSKFLQARDLDILAAISLITKTEIRIKNIRSDDAFFVILQNAKVFSEEHFGDFEVTNSRSSGYRKKKVPKRSGELAADEAIQDPIQYIKISVYFKTIDIVLQQFQNKFHSQAISVLKDIGLLSLRRMQDNTVVPQDAFDKLCEMYKFNQEKVRSEYIMFKQILKDLDHKLLTNLPKFVHDNNSDDENSNSDKSDEGVELDSVMNTGSLINIFQTINKTNLAPEFENLYSIIKLSLTLPTSSCSVERSFSKLKIIKSRLRSTMDQKRLENLMVISCEPDVYIDISKVIDIFASKSSVLVKLLTF